MFHNLSGSLRSVASDLWGLLTKSSGTQGNCTDDPPAVDGAFRNFTSADSLPSSCQLILTSGLFKWTNGDGVEPFLPSQKHVWLHGLHIINVEQVTTLRNHSTIHWAPPFGATLYMTNVHVHALHTGVIITEGADAFAAGMSHAYVTVDSTWLQWSNACDNTFACMSEAHMFCDRLVAKR